MNSVNPINSSIKQVPQQRLGTVQYFNQWTVFVLNHVLNRINGKCKIKLKVNPLIGIVHSVLVNGVDRVLKQFKFFVSIIKINHEHKWTVN